MYVNAYLHTSCALLMRSLSPLEQPSVELGAGDGSFSEAALTGDRLTLLSSVVPTDAVHLQKRTIAQRVAIIDAEYLPFEGKSLKFVFMIDGLYHVAHQAQAIQEIARVLAPGGIFAFNYPVGDFFRRCFPPQRLFASLRLESLRRRDLDRLKRLHFVDELLSAPALRGLLAHNGLEVIEERPFASLRSMRAAYLLYWIVRYAEGRILDYVVRLEVVRKVMDTLRDEVFYPLLLKDGEDCREKGGTYVWWIAKKQGEPAGKVGPLTFVCPICKRAFLHGAYSCSACARTFRLADKTPIFLVHGQE
jgi:SAM-dependent methyltransferase